MIRLSAPSADVLAEVLQTASTAQPTHPGHGTFTPFDLDEVVGRGPEAFDAGKAMLREWRMHRDAGVRVDPVPLAVGNDVVLWTKVLGLSLVFACRITDVFDDDTSFGFTYATLPGHPEQGVETFLLTLDDETVRLHINGESRPALLLNKLSGPIGPIMQKRFMAKYVTVMRDGITDLTTS